MYFPDYYKTVVNIDGEEIRYYRYCIGLNLWRYIFSSQRDANLVKKRLESQGQITDLFLNNSYGFEFKRNREI